MAGAVWMFGGGEVSQSVGSRRLGREGLWEEWLVDSSSGAWESVFRVN
jgi:hypothetical protein